MTDPDLAQVLDVAITAAKAAASVSMRFFRTDVPVQTKPDRSPVTQADLQSEAAIVGAIKATFPSHSLLTEESGVHSGATGMRWVVDPLDGTRGFTRGGTFWGPLVAFELHGEIVAGAMALPALGETYWAARGLGSWRDGTRLQLSATSDWSEATLSIGELSRLYDLVPAGALETLVRTCASARAFGDVASTAMLLNGRADVWIEGGVKIWDIAPSKILIEEAGGRFTDFEGIATIGSGCCIGSNGHVHDHVLRHVSNLH